MIQDEDAVRRELEGVYRRLDEEGLIFLAAGNISVRDGQGMLISPAGASARTITPASFVHARFDGSYDGERRPSSEWSMHADIYRTYEEAQAIVHTHSDHCVALAATNEALPPFHYMVAAYGGNDVKCVPYVTYASPELGRAAVAALAGRSACLLGNHGMICHAPTLEKAFAGALRLEILCRQYICARQAGTVRMLNDEQMAVAVARYKSYG
jgi:L-fuculose-phosphate aldolase